jgi:hypothetical protein
MIRRALRQGEFLDLRGYPAHSSERQELFLGKCHGAILHCRGMNDQHVVVTWLVEDDGHWFVSDGGTSSYWLDEMQEVLTAVKNWLKKNAAAETDGGWKFRPIVKTKAKFKRGDRVYELVDDNGKLVPDYKQGILTVEEEVSKGVYRVGTKDWFRDAVPGTLLKKVARKK